MKKLFTVLATLAVVSTFSVSASALDWKKEWGELKDAVTKRERPPVEFTFTELEGNKVRAKAHGTFTRRALYSIDLCAQAREAWAEKSRGASILGECDAISWTSGDLLFILHQVKK